MRVTIDHVVMCPVRCEVTIEVADPVELLKEPSMSGDLSEVVGVRVRGVQMTPGCSDFFESFADCDFEVYEAALVAAVRKEVGDDR